MKKIRWNIPMICYSGFVALSVLACLVMFLLDTVRGINGQAPVTISIEDCVLSGLEQQADGSYLVTDADPQILLPEQEKPFRRVEMQMQCTQNPGEMSVFYLTKPGQDYSIRQQAWLKEKQPGKYVVELPWKNVVQLRIDPASVPGRSLWLEDITVNSGVPIWQYFVPSWTWILSAVFLPGLAACFLDWLLFAVKTMQNRRKPL